MIALVERPPRGLLATQSGRPPRGFRLESATMAIGTSIPSPRSDLPLLFDLSMFTLSKGRSDPGDGRRNYRRIVSLKPGLDVDKESVSLVHGLMPNRCPVHLGIAGLVVE